MCFPKSVDCLHLASAVGGRKFLVPRRENFVAGAYVYQALAPRRPVLLCKITFNAIPAAKAIKMNEAGCQLQKMT